MEILHSIFDRLSTGKWKEKYRWGWTYLSLFSDDSREWTINTNEQSKKSNLFEECNDELFDFRWVTVLMWTKACRWFWVLLPPKVPYIKKIYFIVPWPSIKGQNNFRNKHKFLRTTFHLPPTEGFDFGWVIVLLWAKAGFCSTFDSKST